MKSSPAKSLKFTNPRIIALVGVFVALCAIATWLLITNHNQKKSSDKPPYITGAKTTSTASTAQPDFNSGSPREIQPADNNKGSAVVADNQGTISQNTSTSNPIVSPTGQISVYSPQSNQVLNNGSQISGAASIPVIKYRVIDNVSGVIAEGSLKVVNGKFAGSLTFNTTASEGRFDIYGAKDDGTEFSNIGVPVRFK